MFSRQRHQKYVCFGAIMFASSAMNNLFVTYYLDLFMNIAEIDSSAFFIGQTIFMLWNALNDPLFGWMSDHIKLPGATGKEHPVMRRITVIRYGGYLWTVAFFLVWAPLVSTNWWLSCFHFTASLCFYDGMLTMVEVNHSALLADISSSGAERAKFNAYSAVCAGLGSLSSFFGHAFWDREGSLFSFRIMALFVAISCWLLFKFSCDGIEQTIQSGSIVMSPVRKSSASCTTCGPGSSNGFKSSKSTTAADRTSVMLFLRELLKQPNFWLFQGLYFIQAFDCTFEKNHFSIFLDGLAGELFSARFLGLIISVSFIFPWVLTVIITPMIQQKGLYKVVQTIFLARVLYCGFSFLFGPYFPPWFGAWFLLSNRVMSESVCRVCPLIITDLIDEDRFIHRRKDTVSATIVGASTLLGKCSQSLAPMFGYAMLQNYGNGGKPWGEADKSFFLSLLIVVPLFCVAVQNSLWLSFSLKGTYLKQVKDFASMRDEGDYGV